MRGRKKASSRKVEGILGVRIEEVIRLYAAALAHAGLPTRSTAARRLIRIQVERRFRNVLTKGGIMRFKRNRRGRLEAAIFAVPGSFVFVHRESETHWSFDLFSAPGPRSEVARTNAWFSRELRRIRPMIGEKIDSYLEVWQRPLLPELRRLGIHAVGLALRGRIDRALAGLRAHYPELERELRESSYRLRPIRTRRDVRAYIEIIRAEFTRNPKFGWFVADPKFIDEMKTDLFENLRRKRDWAWVFERNGDVVGGFDFFLPKKGPFAFLAQGSFGLNLARTHQGKGLARFAYWVALKEMRRSGARFFGGTTGQPGVLRLAQVMGRRCTGIEVLGASRPPFPKRYFDRSFRSLVHDAR